MLHDGEILSIVVMETAQGPDGTTKYDVAASNARTEASAKEIGDAFYGVSKVNKGESYIFRNGVWSDWIESDLLTEFNEATQNMFVTDNFSIKAYMVAHTHAWEYSGSGATITASCGNAGCTVATPPTLTVNAPMLKVEGGEGSAEATVEASDTWTGDNGLPAVPAVEYYSGETRLDGAPTTAGTYTARITVGDTTAEVEYTIEKKGTNPSSSPASAATGGGSAGSPAGRPSSTTTNGGTAATTSASSGNLARTGDPASIASVAALAAAGAGLAMAGMRRRRG